MSFPDDYQAVSTEALVAFRAATAEIIKETVAQAMICKADIKQHGDQAERLITSGFEFTTRMLDTAMSMGAISLLEDELSWAKDRLPHDGVSMQHLLNRLTIFRKIVLNKLPPREGSEVVRYIDWMIARLEKHNLPN
jgi:hypothetical protein